MRTKWIAAVAAAAVVGSVAVVLVQSGGQQPPAERTLTGCVRIGSAPSVFVLRGASATSPESAAPGDGQQLPEDYLLVSIPAAVSLEAHVNHRVAVTGVVSEPGVGPPLHAVIHSRYGSPRGTRGMIFGGRSTNAFIRDSGMSRTELL